MNDTLETLGDPLRALRERFESLVERHRPTLWRYCLRLTGSPWDAEDLAQEVLTRAFARLAQYWQPLEPRAYLLRTATHAWVDRLRRTRGLVPEPLEAAEDVPAHAGGGPEVAREALEALVHLLPPRQRVAFLLTEAFDFRGGEVAALLGTTEGAVKATLHRARTTLARAAAEQAPAGPGASAQDTARSHEVARFLEAFNRRDPEALLALLHEDVTVDIVGAGVDVGREVARRSAVGSWASGTDPQRVRPGRVAGEPVLVVESLEGETPALLSLMRLVWAEGRVVRWENYYFCPELLAWAAAELGLPFRRQRPFTTPSGYGFQAP